MSDEQPLNASSSIALIVSGRERDFTQESVKAPPPREVFEGRDSIDVRAAYHLGGDGDVFEIGGMDANQRNRYAVFVHFKDKAFGHEGAECCFWSSLYERQSACGLRIKKGDRSRKMFVTVGLSGARNISLGG